MFLFTIYLVQLTLLLVKKFCAIWWYHSTYLAKLQILQESIFHRYCNDQVDKTNCSLFKVKMKVLDQGMGHGQPNKRYYRAYIQPRDLCQFKKFMK